MTTVGVIGGGILGVAIGRTLARDHGLEVTILEKEARLAVHQTGHNSGVVHAGLYYAPDSLKARLCTAGREMTRDFCAEHRLPYRELGKLVVATRPEEVSALDRIEERARRNRVPGLSRLRPEEMREVEPHVGGVAALHSPHTAVVDFVAITEAMAQELRCTGGSILFNHEVTGLRERGGAVEVRTPGEVMRFDRLVVCAGLQSDELALLAGADASPRILPFRGEYRMLVPDRAHLVRGMIYPVPDPAFPFLGVHFTRGVYDDVHVGPNAVPALAREGYRWREASMREAVGLLRWPGASTLAKRHWRMGAKEIAASLVKPLYFRDARRFIPELRYRDLGPNTAAGVRAQAWARGGELLDDFAVDRVGPITLLRNAPSPAATSAMSIAEYVVREYVLTD